VLAGWLAPRLAQPLPPSRRRQAVCVLQVVVLGLMLAPPVMPPVSVALAAAAFAALAWSFAADVAWLLRAR
jgi:hydrogenase/urease accessory protein HupE